MRHLLIAAALLLAIPAPGAEFLVYRGPHWMDETPTTHPIRKTAEFEARERPGDIVQVYLDGTCKEKPAKDSKFYILKVPDMPLKDAQHLGEAQMDNVLSADAVTLKRRRWNIAMLDLPLAATTSMAKDGLATITKTQLTMALDDKASTTVVVLSP